MKNIIQNEFNKHIETANLLHNQTDAVAKSAQLCIDTIKNGGKILLLGNGGSAADAQHIAAELIGRYKTDRKGLPAVALTTDSSALTAIANDFGYESVFDRQVEALANKGDTVIGISTSGKSSNVISALKLASKLKCTTIGFSGQDAEVMNKICDVNLTVPSSDTARIQEMHILIGHTICHLIDLGFKV
ncbi:D-sedoheptulose 7-phosphate isomerase [Candidatus Thioglobus sp.]|nr:D-sedoheptulose 7-phosphate isomerase [Candidatus Thioglobus sp.]